MKKITKENIEEFMDYYHGFHDSYIKDLNYDFKGSKIELLIDVYWSGKPTIKEDGTYETNKTKIKMYFNKVIQFNFKEVYEDYIYDAFLKYIKLNNEESICFATDIKEPLISIVM